MPEQKKKNLRDGIKMYLKHWISEQPDHFLSLSQIIKLILYNNTIIFFSKDGKWMEFVDADHFDFCKKFALKNKNVGSSRRSWMLRYSK